MQRVPANWIWPEWITATADRSARFVCLAGRLCRGGLGRGRGAKEEMENGGEPGKGRSLLALFPGRERKGKVSQGKACMKDKWCLYICVGSLAAT